MTKLKSLMIATTAIAFVGAWTLSAPVQAAEDPHHPAATAAGPPSAGTSQPQTSTTPGIMGGQRMMGGEGMMGGGQGMMSDPSMMNMMEMMMRQGGPGPCGPGMAGEATIDRIEGRIAFLRAELKITDAQAGAWNDFADVLRSNAKKLGDVRASMMTRVQSAEPQQPTMTKRLEAQEQWLAARLEGTRAMKTAFAKLYETLSADQKKTAEDLLAPHMGMGVDTMMPMGEARQ